MVFMNLTRNSHNNMYVKSFPHLPLRTHAVVILVAIFAVLFFSLRAQAESYNLLDTNVRQYKQRVEEKRKHIKELAEKKSELRDQAAIRGILNEMIVDAKELKESFVKFQKEKKRLLYEYPQKGDLTERQYKRFEIETIEEMNTLSNIDLRLKGVLNKVEETYEKPPEVLAADKQKKEKSKHEDESPRKTEHQTTVKEEPSPASTRPVLSF